MKSSKPLVDGLGFRAFVFGAAFCLLSFAGLNVGRAQIVANPPQFSFPACDQGASFDGVFQLENRGKLDRKLIDIKFDCQCARSLQTPRILAAGKTTSLKFRFDTKGLEGQLKKYMTLRLAAMKSDSTLGKVETLRLAIAGEVLAAWRLDPLTVQLGEVDPRQELSGVCRVRRRGDKIVRLRLGEKHVAAVATRFERSVNGKAGEGLAQSLVWKGRAPKQPGPFRWTVPVFSDDIWKPSSILIIAGEVLGDLRVSPRRLSFGVLDSKTASKRELLINSQSGRVFRVLECAESPTLFVDFDSDLVANRLVLAVVAPKGLRSGTHSGVLRIRTDRADQPWLLVPWSLHLKR
ncbi:MAG: DUF1573 domain-containing protein [Planctomycetota bacterium]